MFAIGRNTCQIQMCIDRRIPMTGEVFCRRQDAILWIVHRALQERRDVRGNLRGIFAVGADIDDRVIRIAVHVSVRKKDPVHSDRSSFTRGDDSFVARS